MAIVSRHINTVFITVSVTRYKIKIESGDFNDIVMATYDFDGDLASYGFHSKYKNNPEHLVVQGNDGFEQDFSPTDLGDALAIRDGKTIAER